jgi:hypothetical protein
MQVELATSLFLTGVELGEVLVLLKENFFAFQELLT